MNAEDVLRSIEKEALTRYFPIIGAERGVILDDVVKETRPRTVLEIGTFVGYSAIRIGRLLGKGGRITCVDVDEGILKVARKNFEKAGLSGMIETIAGDAKSVIPRLTSGFDMVFLDAVKEDYLTYLKSCERLLGPGSVVVADNVKSHAEEVAGYLDYVRNSGLYSSRYREVPSGYRYGVARGETDGVEISVRL